MRGIGRTARDEPVYQITGARISQSDDVHGRERRYLISMGIRTACFLLAILASGPLRWVLIAASLVLPYVAVVAANAGRERLAPPPEAMLQDEQPALGASPQDGAPAEPPRNPSRGR